MRYKPSKADAEENSFDYIVRWKDRISSIREIGMRHQQKLEPVCLHYGPGERRFYKDYDEAWDVFEEMRDDPDYLGVGLFKILPDGSEAFLRGKK